MRKKGVQFGNAETIRENQAIRANLRIDSRESGHLSSERRGRFPAQRLSVLLPLIVLPLELSPTDRAIWPQFALPFDRKLLPAWPLLLHSYRAPLPAEWIFQRHFSLHAWIYCRDFVVNFAVDFSVDFVLRLNQGALKGTELRWQRAQNADFRRKPQIGLCHLRCVTFSSAL